MKTSSRTNKPSNKKNFYLRSDRISPVKFLVDIGNVYYLGGGIGGDPIKAFVFNFLLVEEFTY